jgi:DNA-binding IclR family transcriptional regulator
VLDATGRTTAAVALSVPVKDFAKRRRQLETLIRRGGEELSRLLA